MSGRLGLAVAAAILLVAGAALWCSGAWQGVPAGEANGFGSPPMPAAEAEAIDPQLMATVEAARAASARANADAEGADAVAAAADKVAASAAKSAADAKAAAEEARTAATKACKAPGEAWGCATGDDGTRYEGAQSCRREGCGPEGYGVFTDTARGWESQGKWENWSLVLGCDRLKGAITYCGQQVGSAWSGYGVSYNANAAAISAEWLKGAGKNPIQLDYPTGSRMRGEMTQYELDGLGIYERADKRVLRGRWQAGRLLSGVVAYPGTGDVVSGAFVEGNAQVGAIAYRDGRLFVGEIEDGPSLAQARPKVGVLYAPGGRIETQGTWREGRPAAAH